MYAAIIEWPSDSIEPPDLITSNTVEGTFWPVINRLRDMSGDYYPDDPDFIKNHPYPTDGNDTAALATWLWAMRDATTSPWVEFFDASRTLATKLNIMEVLSQWTDVSAE